MVVLQLVCSGVVLGTLLLWGMGVWVEAMGGFCL